MSSETVVVIRNQNYKLAILLLGLLGLLRLLGYVIELSPDQSVNIQVLRHTSDDNMRRTEALSVVVEYLSVQLISPTLS